MHSNVRRASLILALTSVAWVPATGALAGGLGGAPADQTSTTITTPAPDGDASAVAAEVDGILAVGKTAAHAGSGGGSSSADALNVLGNRISGGDQDGVGSNSGNIIGTGDTPLGDAELAPWSNEVGNDNGGYQARAEAALAHANLADAVELWVLHSESDAAWSPMASSGNAQSDGAELAALDLFDLKVLHSEAHSTGKGKSDLLVINGTEIGSSEQFDGMCQIDASPLVAIICLTAKGGTGADGITSATSDVATVDAGDGALTGTVSGSTSQGGSAAPTTKPPATTGQHNGGRTAAGRVPAANPPAQAAPAARPGLPFTGADTGRWASIAAALVALGGAMVAFTRRRPWAGTALAG